MDEAPRPPVVGIGTSAGGITALQTLFESIGAAPALTFVVLVHQQPDQPSQLARLFAAWTPMPVRDAGDGVVIAPGHVYIALPGRRLGFDGDSFRTRPDEPMTSRGLDTVDGFFDELAASFGARAIAVVLSGTGHDGGAGVMRIRQAGGMVLVQDPVTAMHDGMPNAAIASGAADHIMPLGALARQLLACGAPDHVRAGTSALADDVTAALDGMIALIRARAGIDLADYRTTPLLWRIQRRMMMRRVPLFLDYEALLHDDPAELETLIRGLPIHVTEFFRDGLLWDRLQRDVIAPLFDEPRDAPIRAWTTACSTGEEAYSLAMMLAEQAEARARAADFQLFATDVSADIVARAGRGVFTAAAVEQLAPDRQRRFFYAVDGSYRVLRELRAKLVFAPHDLLADPPFTGLDIVTCRNLLIYLEPEASRRVIHLLNAALRVGGFLFLGNSETLSPAQGGFQELVPGTHIYQKTGPAPAGDVAFPSRPARLGRARSTGSAVTQARTAADADAAWSEALRRSNAELDSSREELQALNEELRASNDQLDLANDELAHANARLRVKLDELETQSNVLSSGAVMTLFLDEELRVRFFTPAMSELFPLRAVDIGRRITDLVPRFDQAGFVDQVRVVMRTGEPTEAEVRTVDGGWYLERIRPFRTDGVTAIAGVAVNFTDITDRKHVDEALRRNQGWLAAQKEAFQAAMNGESLATSLGVLIRAAIDLSGDERRCAFYIADDAGASLRHVVGMSERYARQVDGFAISPESLACGLAVASGKPVITPDVVDEPRWKPWRWLARDHGYRGCWSFPVETSTGKLVGSFAMYFAAPREPTVRDRELAAILSQTAAIIISRHHELNRAG